jgi:hypothetical protein
MTTPSWQLGDKYNVAQKQLREALRKIPAHYREAACRQAQAELALEERRDEQAPAGEYLYGAWREPDHEGIYSHGYVGGYLDRDPVTAKVRAKFRIIKKTAKRIHYVRQELVNRSWGPVELEIGSVDRQKLETQGYIQNTSRWWLKDDRVLYLHPPGAEPVQIDKAYVSKLKAEMAAAHPDRGGTSAAFREARKRYVEARRKMRQTPT